MQFFDTHAHLDHALENGLLSSQMQQAMEAGVEYVAIPNCDMASLPDVLEVCRLFPNRLYPMCGLHPTYIQDDVEKQLVHLHSALIQLHHPFVAVGEIGLDLYWRQDNLTAQQEVLQKQMEWAAELKLPVSLHSRSAFQETLEVVSGFKGRVRGIFHCFSGSVAEARQVIDRGYYIGIGGNVTYKNNATIATLQAIGLESVVLETDSPYLAPLPFRGKPNQPAYTRLVAEYLAGHLSLPLEEVGRITTNNARNVFSLPG